MMELLEKLLSRSKIIWENLTNPQKIMVISIIGITFLGLVGISIISGRTNYSILFSNLTQEDTSAIIEQLKQYKVPYKLGEKEDQILVPSKIVYETRIKLASNGLPAGGVVGFEIFDKTSFGITDFTQKLNYQRGLQGELSRTINQIKGVVQARVHLVIPHPSVFIEKEKPATASVILQLKPGLFLSQNQIRGIVHLVSSSVEGLSPERVTILDSTGKLLMSPAEKDISRLTANQIELKSYIESDLERRVQSMLDTAVGINKATVRVAAEMNFDSIERTEEKYDPNSVVKQEQRVSENTQGVIFNPVGVPGASSNISNPPNPLPPSNSKTNKESEVINYEISRTVEKKISAPGEIRRLSIGVILNGDYRIVKEEDGVNRKVYSPRKLEDIEKLKRVVMGAVGFNTSRGDEIEIIEIPFDTSALEKEMTERIEGEGRKEFSVIVFTIIPLLITALAVYLFLKYKNRLLSRVYLRDEGTMDTEGFTIKSGERDEFGIESKEKLRLDTVKREEIKNQAAEMAFNKPKEFAQLIRAWMIKKKPTTT